jgi:hypothetical protein
VTYLASGGGGATPYDIDRPPEVRLELHGQHLSGEVVRLEDHDAAHPSRWRVKDKFELTLQP